MSGFLPISIGLMGGVEFLGVVFARRAFLGPDASKHKRAGILLLVIMTFFGVMLAFTLPPLAGPAGLFGLLGAWLGVVGALLVILRSPPK